MARSPARGARHGPAAPAGRCVMVPEGKPGRRPYVNLPIALALLGLGLFLSVAFFTRRPLGTLSRRKVAAGKGLPTAWSNRRRHVPAHEAWSLEHVRSLFMQMIFVLAHRLKCTYYGTRTAWRCT